VTTWLNTSFPMRFRVIDGLTFRFVRGEDRGEHDMLISRRAYRSLFTDCSKGEHHYEPCSSGLRPYLTGD
jgi:hypothetical protein